MTLKIYLKVKISSTGGWPPIVLDNFCPNHVSVGGLPTEIFEWIN